MRVVKLTRCRVNGGKWWYDQVFMLLSSSCGGNGCDSVDPTPSHHLTTLLTVVSYAILVGHPWLSTMLQVVAVSVGTQY